VSLVRIAFICTAVAFVECTLEELPNEKAPYEDIKGEILDPKVMAMPVFSNFEMACALLIKVMLILLFLK
jgi:hypothetical protein